MKSGFIGFIMGAGLVYVCLVYPAQTRDTVNKAAKVGGDAVSSGLQYASTAVDHTITDQSAKAEQAKRNGGK